MFGRSPVLTETLVSQNGGNTFTRNAESSRNDIVPSASLNLLAIK